MYDVLKQALLDLEEQGEIVLCSANHSAARFLEARLRSVVPSAEITPVEFSSLRALVLMAINDKRFFDWEMPTLTGMNAEEFSRLAEKLPNV